MTERMNEAIRARWLAALRSGDYAQGRELLARRASPDGAWTFCCLGVLCELAVTDGVVGCSEVDEAAAYDGAEDEEYLEPNRRYYGGYDTVLPPAVVRWAGLPSDNPVVDGVDLASRNDGREYATVDDGARALPAVAPQSFDEVARLVEEHL